MKEPKQPPKQPQWKLPPKPVKLARTWLETTIAREWGKRGLAQLMEGDSKLAEEIEGVYPSAVKFLRSCWNEDGPPQPPLPLPPHVLQEGSSESGAQASNQAPS